MHQKDCTSCVTAERRPGSYKGPHKSLSNGQAQYLGPEDGGFLGLSMATVARHTPCAITQQRPRVVRNHHAVTVLLLMRFKSRACPWQLLFSILSASSLNSAPCGVEPLRGDCLWLAGLKGPMAGCTHSRGHVSLAFQQLCVLGLKEKSANELPTKENSAQSAIDT